MLKEERNEIASIKEESADYSQREILKSNQSQRNESFYNKVNKEPLQIEMKFDKTKNPNNPLKVGFNPLRDFRNPEFGHQ